MTMTAAEILRISDETDRAELAEYLTNLNAFAKKQAYSVGNLQHETPWDRAHRRMDGPLEDMLAVLKAGG